MDWWNENEKNRLWAGCRSNAQHPVYSPPGRFRDPILPAEL